MLILIALIASIAIQLTIVGLVIISLNNLNSVIKELVTATEDNKTAALTFRSVLGALTIQSDATGASVIRIEAQAAGVAQNLHDSQERADAVEYNANPGEASDAASRSNPSND